MNRGVVIVIIAAALALGIGLSLKPWQVYREQRKLADEAQREMRMAESKKTELTRQRAHAPQPRACRMRAAIAHP